MKKNYKIDQQKDSIKNEHGYKLVIIVIKMKQNEEELRMERLLIDNGSNNEVLLFVIFVGSHNFSIIYAKKNLIRLSVFELNVFCGLIVQKI